MTIKPITERAMLIKVSVHQWTARRHDQKVSREVAEHHGSEERMGSYQKDLIDKDRLSEISALASQIRTVLFGRTLPWLDAGTRILPSAFYFDTMAELKALIHKRDEAVRVFLGQWEAIVADARVRLNGLFNEEDYPNPNRLRRAFAVELTTFPIPAAGDFRVDLGSEAQAEVQAQIETRVAELLDAATRDLWHRIHAVVSHMVERLRAYAVSPEGKILSTFRDSLVDNIRELTALLPGLNIAGSADLDRMAKELDEALCGYDASQLRENTDLRNTVATRAEHILHEITSFLA